MYIYTEVPKEKKKNQVEKERKATVKASHMAIVNIA